VEQKIRACLLIKTEAARIGSKLSSTLHEPHIGLKAKLLKAPKVKVPLNIRICRALKRKDSIDMTFDLAQVRMLIHFYWAIHGLRQRWQTLNSSNELNTKRFAIIHTYIHSLFTWVLLFLRNHGNGEKEVWKFGHLEADLQRNTSIKSSEKKSTHMKARG
jgi:hypothetical protein